MSPAIESGRCPVTQAVTSVINHIIVSRHPSATSSSHEPSIIHTFNLYKNISLLSKRYVSQSNVAPIASFPVTTVAVFPLTFAFV